MTNDLLTVEVYFGFLKEHNAKGFPSLSHVNEDLVQTRRPCLREEETTEGTDTSSKRILDQRHSVLPEPRLPRNGNTWESFPRSHMILLLHTQRLCLLLHTHRLSMSLLLHTQQRFTSQTQQIHTFYMMTMEMWSTRLIQSSTKGKNIVLRSLTNTTLLAPFFQQTGLFSVTNSYFSSVTSKAKNNRN